MSGGRGHGRELDCLEALWVLLICSQGGESLSSKKQTSAQSRGRQAVVTEGLGSDLLPPTLLCLPHAQGEISVRMCVLNF